MGIVPKHHVMLKTICGSIISNEFDKYFYRHPSLIYQKYLKAFVFSVFAGRWLMSFWTGTAKIHELYTAACGLYVCWLTIRAVTVLVAWMPQGRRVIFQKVKEWSLMVSLMKYFYWSIKEKKKKVDYIIVQIFLANFAL